MEWMHAVLWRAVGLVLAVTGYAITTVACAILCVVPGIPLLLFRRRGQRERHAMWTNVFVSRMVLLLLCAARLRVRGKEHIPFGSAYLVVANHRSWLDIPLVITTSHTQGISKLLVFFLPFLGQLGYLAGAVYFHRYRNQARRRALNDCLLLLRAGNGLHVYPEGTRTRDGELREKVQLGLVRACYAEGIPCIPTGILGTEKVLPVKGFFMRPFQTLHIHFRAPVRPENFPDEEAFAQAVWGQVGEEVGRMRQLSAPSG